MSFLKKYTWLQEQPFTPTPRLTVLKNHVVYFTRHLDESVLSLLDLKGTPRWTKRIGFGTHFTLQAFVETADGGIMAVASFMANGSDQNACYFKISAQGNLQWFKTTPSGTGTTFQSPFFALALQGNYLLAFGNTGLILKVNELGEILGSQQYHTGHWAGMVAYQQGVALIEGRPTSNVDSPMLPLVLQILDENLQVTQSKGINLDPNELSTPNRGYQPNTSALRVLPDGQTLRLSAAVGADTLYWDLNPSLAAGNTVPVRLINQSRHEPTHSIGPDFYLEKQTGLLALTVATLDTRTEYSFRIPSLSIANNPFQEMEVSGFTADQFFVRFGDYLGTVPRSLQFDQSCFDLLQSDTLPLTAQTGVITLSDESLVVSPAPNQFIDSTPSQFSNWGLAVEEICVFTPSDDNPPEEEPEPVLTLTPFDAPGTVVQSTHVYAQAAGSTGADGSATGVHLRWIFKHTLGQNHLPKGDYFTENPMPVAPVPDGEIPQPPDTFNRVDDYVKVFRMPYVPTYTEVDFADAPSSLDTSRRIWLYHVLDRVFLLKFLDADQYDAALAQHNPSTRPKDFLEAYGNGLVEFESQDALFFALEMGNAMQTDSAQLRLEALTVEGAGVNVRRNVAARQSYAGPDAEAVRLEGENLKSVRWQANGLELRSIKVECYLDQLSRAQAAEEITYVGRYALSTDDARVLRALEPTPGLVDGQWPLYDEQARVRVENYRRKWNETPTDPEERNLRTIVEEYLTLSSDHLNNQAATELTYGTGEEAQTYELSFLDLLQLASMDYHQARMLGLGTLDTSVTAPNQRLQYIIEYTSLGDLGDGNGRTETTHQYITLPTGLADERLPLTAELQAPVKGIVSTSGETPAVLTDDEGYVPGARTRYLTLYAEPQPEYEETRFFASSSPYNLAKFTFPVHIGLRYKAASESDWRRPGLYTDPDYLAATPAGVVPFPETIPLNIPEAEEVLYVHEITEEGQHTYSSYGINWFGRASQDGPTWDIITDFPPQNQLQPPGSLTPWLIREESPLQLTTAEEQTRLAAITEPDKTLVRLRFDYHTAQELRSYLITPEKMGVHTDPLDPQALLPDEDEAFADEIEVFFRNRLPHQVIGKVRSIADDPTNPLRSILTTEPYSLFSQGPDEQWIPNLQQDLAANFAGGIIVVEDTEYLIHEARAAHTGETGPTFWVYKKEVTDALTVGKTALPTLGADLQAPALQADGKFLAMENMQPLSSWGGEDPTRFTVQVGENWPIHREVVTVPGPNAEPDQVVEKTRGIWDTASVTPIEETVDYNPDGTPNTTFAGLYQITLDQAILGHHPQYQLQGTSVDYQGGIVRVHTQLDPNGPRKTLTVLRTQGIGEGTPLTLIASDEAWSSANSDSEPVPRIQEGTAVSVHYYPSYQVHLYADPTQGLVQEHVEPATGEGIRYTLFALRSHARAAGFSSRMSTPAMMLAQEHIAPRVPKAPAGLAYTTRPNSFGKSTYTFSYRFEHRPHGLLFYRAADTQLLHALYAPSTVATIEAALSQPENAAFATNRWQNLLGFAYTYPDSPNEDGHFARFPDTPEGYRLPSPDHESLFAEGEVPGSLKPGDLMDRIQAAIASTFTPLTEVPLLYDYLSAEPSYQPRSTPQVIRDRNGALLSPTDAAFDIGPMAKILGDYQVQFTDFKIDGTSGNLYFYTCRELGNSLQFGDMGPILGPVQPVNTRPANAPVIRRAMPLPPGFGSLDQHHVQFEVNAYPESENIRQLCLYRTLESSQANSIRTMKLVKTVNLMAEEQDANSIWQLHDTFEDLPEVPFADTLYYRVVAMREVTYADRQGQKVTEYVGSEPSKLVMSSVVEYNPTDGPTLRYQGTVASDRLTEVVLEWDKVSHNARYLVYRQNATGNWSQIKELEGNDATVNLALTEATPAIDSLPLTDAEGKAIYHRFKVVVENSGGLLSEKAPVLTVPSTQHSIEG